MSDKMYPQLPHQQAPPGYPQGYQQPPTQGYQPPPQQGYPNQPPPAYAYPAGYPAQPPPGQQYPPQQYQAAAQGQHNVIIHQTTTVQPVQPPIRSTGVTLGGLFSGAGKLANSLGNSMQKELDIHATSATLCQFRSGAILQFISRANNMALRTLPNGALDCIGNPAMNDPYTHYKVQNHGNNIVTMNSMGNPTFYVTIDKMGNSLGNGPGGYESKLRLHETLKGFITFESLSNPNSHVAIMPNGQMKPANLARKDQDSQFAIRVIAPVGVQHHHTTIVYK